MKPYKVEVDYADKPLSTHDTAREAHAAAEEYNERQPPEAPFAYVYWWDDALGEWTLV